MIRISAESDSMVTGVVMIAAVLLAIFVLLPLPSVSAETPESECGDNNFVRFPVCRGISLRTSSVTVTAPSPYGLTTSYAACVANKMRSEKFDTFLMAGSYTFQFRYETEGSSTGSGVAIYYSANSITFPNFNYVGSVYDVVSTDSQLNFTFSVPTTDTYSFAVIGFNNNKYSLGLFDIAIVCDGSDPKCYPATSTSWPQFAPSLSSPVNLPGITGFGPPMSSVNCYPESNLLLMPSSAVVNGVSVSVQDLYIVCYPSPTLRAYRGLTSYADSWPLPGRLADLRLIKPNTVYNPRDSGLIYLLAYSYQVRALQVYSFQLTSGNFTLVAQLPSSIRFNECLAQAYVSWLGLHIMCTYSTARKYDVLLVTLNSTSPTTSPTIIATSDSSYFYTQVTASGTVAIVLSDRDLRLLTYVQQSNSWSTLYLPTTWAERIVMDALLNVYYVVESPTDNRVCVRNSSTAYTFMYTPITAPESRCFGPIQMSAGGSNPPNLYVKCTDGVYRFQWQSSTSSYLSAESVGGIGNGPYDFFVSSDESVLVEQTVLPEQSIKSPLIILKRPVNVLTALTVDAFAANESVRTNLQLFPTDFNYQLSNYFLYLNSEFTAAISIQFNLQCSAGSTQVWINGVAISMTVACGSSVLLPVSTGLTSVQLTYTSIVPYPTGNGSYSVTYNYSVTINKSPPTVPFQLTALQQGGGGFPGGNIAFVNNSVFFVQQSYFRGTIKRITISDALPITQAASNASEIDIQSPQCPSVDLMAANANGVLILGCEISTAFGRRWVYVSSLDSGDTWTGWMQMPSTPVRKVALFTLNNGTTMMYTGCFNSRTYNYGIQKYMINSTGGMEPIGECILSDFRPPWFTALPNGDIIYSSSEGILSVYTTANGSNMTVSLPIFCVTPTELAEISVPKVKGGNYTVAVACNSKFKPYGSPVSTDYGSVILLTGFGSEWSAQVLSTPSVCISPSSVFVDAAANLYAVCGIGNSLIRWDSSVISAAVSQPQKLSPQELSQQAIIFFAGNASNAFVSGRGFPTRTANGETWIALMGANYGANTFLMEIGSTPDPQPTNTPSNAGNSLTLVVVSVVAGVLGLAIIAVAAVVVKRRRQNRTGDDVALWERRQIQVSSDSSARSRLLGAL